MGLKNRLRRLEREAGGVGCPECGTVPGEPVRIAVCEDSDEKWSGYPAPLLCAGCGQVLRFTLVFAAPGEGP
jgi:hypothetical protein